MRVVWSLLHGSAVEVADLGKREDLVRIGCVDRAEVERMLQPRCEVGLLVSEYLGTESMIRALRVNQVDFALMDSVEAFLRKDEGLVSELMIGGEEYELVVNSRGSSGQVEQGRGKLRVGVDDFGKSLMLGKAGSRSSGASPSGRW